MRRNLLIRVVESFDKNKIIDLNFQRHLLKLVKKMLLSIDIYTVIRIGGSLQHQLYRLPKSKTHKGNVPIQPILLRIGSVQHKLAALLQPVLNKYLKYSIKNLFTLFANYIQNCSFFNFDKFLFF